MGEWTAPSLGATALPSSGPPHRSVLWWRERSKPLVSQGRINAALYSGEGSSPAPPAAVQTEKPAKTTFYSKGKQTLNEGNEMQASSLLTCHLGSYSLWRLVDKLKNSQAQWQFARIILASFTSNTERFPCPTACLRALPRSFLCYLCLPTSDRWWTLQQQLRVSLGKSLLKGRK